MLNVVFYLAAGFWLVGAALSAEPPPAPKQLPTIDHEHPLFHAAWFRRMEDFDQFARQYPPELKPLTVFNTWNSTCDSPAMREAIERSGAKITLGIGFKNVGQTPAALEAAKKYPFVLGYFGTERGDKFARNELRGDLDALADMGGTSRTGSGFGVWGRANLVQPCDVGSCAR